MSALVPLATALPPLQAGTSLASLFPNGIAHYAAGGVLVGLGVVVIYFGTGIIPGASTFLETTLSYVSKVPQFNQPKYLASRDWRVVFTLGIVLGAAIFAVTVQSGLLSVPFYQSGTTGELYEVAGVTLWQTDVQWWRLLAGGVLVGIGTRVGKGCTSGHGVCGVGSVSQTSIVNVATFLFVAIGTALVVQALGVTP